MPVITHVKATREVIEGYASDDAAVAREDFCSFRDSLTLYGDDDFSRRHGFPLVYGWTPKYPAAAFGSFGTIPEEALYRSNFEAVRERFWEALGIELGSGSSDTFEIPAEDPRALALALVLDRRAESYPAFDDEAVSALESELIREGIDSYFRDDVIGAFDGDPAFDGVFSLPGERPDIHAARILEEAVRAIACDAVAYSGELYIDAIETHVSQMNGNHYRGVGGNAAGYARNLRADIGRERRAAFEEVYPPMFDAGRD